MMKQQLVWQEMSDAPKDRKIIVCLKSWGDPTDIIRVDVVEWDLVLNDRKEIELEYGLGTEWYSPGEEWYYNSSDFIGWSEVPVLPQAK